MKMDGDVMKMRALPVLDLPAGKTVELKPGGYHIMLLDLKAPLAKDTTVPVTLTFKDAKGTESKQELNLPVGTTAPALRRRPQRQTTSTEPTSTERPCTRPCNLGSARIAMCRLVE